MNRRLLSALLALVGSSVSLILAAAHTKKELIDLRRQEAEKVVLEHKEYRVKKETSNESAFRDE